MNLSEEREAEGLEQTPCGEEWLNEADLREHIGSCRYCQTEIMEAEDRG